MPATLTFNPSLTAYDKSLSLQGGVGHVGTIADQRVDIMLLIEQTIFHRFKVQSLIILSLKIV